MYEFQELLNKTLNQPRFDAKAFTLVLELGENFCKFSGSTDLTYRKASKSKLGFTWLRMKLAPNEGGVNRLKIHYVSDERVRMDFYHLDVLPNGRKLKTNVTIVRDVEFAYLLDVFEQVTGLYMGRTGEPGGGNAQPVGDDDF